MSQQYPFQCNIAQALNIIGDKVSAHSAWYYERTPDL